MGKRKEEKGERLFHIAFHAVLCFNLAADVQTCVDMSVDAANKLVAKGNRLNLYTWVMAASFARTTIL